jgi:N utilization substance protein B
MKSRTKARSIALQVLYEVDLMGHEPGFVLENLLEMERLQGNLDEKVIPFIHEIVSGVVPLAKVLDDHLAMYAPEWPFDEIAVIDRNILRIALWEFGVHKATPMKVAINEAVELAKLFGQIVQLDLSTGSWQCRRSL